MTTPSSANTLPYRVEVRPSARITINRIRLADAVLCLNTPCETVYSIRESQLCPACSSRQFAPVAAWLQGREGR